MIYSKNLRVFATASAFALVCHASISTNLFAMDEDDGATSTGAASAVLRTPTKGVKVNRVDHLLSPIPKRDDIETHPVFVAQRNTIADLRQEADDLHGLTEGLTAELEQTTAKALALREQRLKLEAERAELEIRLKANEEQLASTEEQRKRAHDESETLRASLSQSETEKQAAIAKHEAHIRALTEARAAKLAKQKEEDGKTNAAYQALAEKLEKERAERAALHKQRMETLRRQRTKLPASPTTNGAPASHDS